MIRGLWRSSSIVSAVAQPGSRLGSWMSLLACGCRDFPVCSDLTSLARLPLHSLRPQATTTADRSRRTTPRLPPPGTQTPIAPVHPAASAASSGSPHVPCLPIRCDARLATGSSRDLAFLPPYLLGNPNHAPHPSPAIRRCNDLKANPASHEGGRERDEWDVSSLSLTAVRAETGSRRSVNRKGITRE